MDEAIEVVRATLIKSGNIASDFTGFSGNSTFQFDDGSVWEQTEYKYNYHYAYRPHGVIIDGINGIELSVDGMSETVRIRRVR